MATETASRSRARSSNGGRSSSGGGSSTGALFGAAAAGVAVGLMANIGRKLMVQAPTALAGEWDEALAAEHQVALKIFDALAHTSDTATTKRSMLLMQLKHALAKHALEEENVIYPALREAGEKIDADKLNHDHGYVKQFLYELEAMPKGSPNFLTRLSEFRNQIAAHMREEEDEVFPTLKNRLSAEKNKTLTSLMNKEGLKLA